MNINLTNEEIKELGYLRRCLNSKVVPTERVESFLNGLQQKLQTPVAPKVRKVKTDDRSDRYRMRIISGSHKKIF